MSYGPISNSSGLRGRMEADLGSGNTVSPYPVTIFFWYKELIPTITAARGVFSFQSSDSTDEDAHFGRTLPTAEHRYRSFSKEGANTAQGPTLTYSSATTDIWLPHLYEYPAINDRKINISTQSASNTSTCDFSTGLRYFKTVSATASVNAMAGKIAHIAVWNRNLTTEEKADLLENNLSPALAASSGLQVYWPLTEDEGGSPAPTIGPSGATFTLTSADIAYDADNPSVTTSLSLLVPNMPALYEGASLLSNRASIRYSVISGHSAINADSEGVLAEGTDGETDGDGIFILPGGVVDGEEDDPVTVKLLWTEGSDPEKTYSTIFRTTLVEAD